MAGVIDGFLVSLGFDIDKDSQARFNHSVEDAGKRMAAFGKKAVVAAGALAAVWAKTTASIGKDYNFKNITGVSVKGFAALKRAITAVGGDGEALAGIFSDMSMKLKTMPGYAQQIKQLFGVDVVDSTGKARDLSEVVAEIAERMQGMDQATSKAKADAVGLGGVWDSLMKKDFPEELRRAHSQMDELGDAVDRTSKSSRDLTNAMGELKDTATLALKAVVGELNEEFQIAEKIRDLVSKIPGWTKKIIREIGAAIDTEARIWKESDGPLSFLWNWLDPANVDRIQKEELDRRKGVEASGPEASGTAPPSRAAPAARSAVEAEASGPEASGIATKGFRNRNPGNLRDSKGAFRRFATFEEGYAAMGRQLKMYQNAGAKNLIDILHTYAPQSENDTKTYIRNVASFLSRELGSRVTGSTELNLSDPRILHALQLGMIRQENRAGAENYFRGNSFQRAAAEASKTKAVSKAWSPYRGSRGNTTVNMTFNVSDRRVAQAAARAVNQAVRTPWSVRDLARGAS